MHIYFLLFNYKHEHKYGQEDINNNIFLHNSLKIINFN